MASLSDLRWFKYDNRFYTKTLVDYLLDTISGTLSYDLTSVSGALNNEISNTLLSLTNISGTLQTQLNNVSVTTKNTFGFKVSDPDTYNSIIVPCDCTITNYNSSGNFTGSLDFSVRRGSNLSNAPFTSTEDITPLSGDTWIINSNSTMIPKGNLTPSRSATSSTLDDNDNTYANVQWNDFEYRWSGIKRIHKAIITMSVDSGIFAVTANFDFYYIPNGVTDPASYIQFGTYTHNGNTGTSNNFTVEKKIGSYEWANADGFYLVHSAGTFEAGWARLEEVEVYEYTDDDLYNISRSNTASWQTTSLSEGDALVLKIDTVSGTFDYMDLNLEVEC